MGYTLQLQWSYTPPAGRQISLADIVLPRVLEHHGLHTPQRSTIQFRTYRAQFPSSSSISTSSSSSSTVPDPNSVQSQQISTSSTQPQTHSRYLTSITTLPPPNPPPNNQNQNQTQTQHSQPKIDDTAYLLLDDRTPQPRPQASGEDEEGEDDDVPLSKRKEGKSSNGPANANANASGSSGETGSATSTAEQRVETGEKDEPMVIDVDVTTEEGKGKAANGTITMTQDADEDDFEIIDKPKQSTEHSTFSSNSAPGEIGAHTQAQASSSKTENDKNGKEEVRAPRPRPHQRFRCIAVRPSSNVGPMLQSLLSPFVMGLTKSARATASTTSSLPTPTPLPGSTLLLTLLTFTPASPPSPPVILRVYILPNPTAGSIFLEAEYAAAAETSTTTSRTLFHRNVSLNGDRRNDDAGGAGDAGSAAEVEEVLRTFLEGCLVDGLVGETKWVNLNSRQNGSMDSVNQEVGWEGIERSKRSMFALAKTLRESGFI
ncbi:hypothetical protein IAT40_001375 [Kwoniella sp. CBS 6097]